MYSLNFRLFNRLRESYWFWPSVLTLGAIILGVALPELDAVIGEKWTRAMVFVHASSSDGARAILTTLASATLGVGGVAFSITIVAVSFASSNYGPRLIGNFMSDRVNQMVLGVFVATFTYCITVLTTVRNGATVDSVYVESFVPQIAIYFALILGILCIVSLIAYIHHIPESINIMNLMEKIGENLRNSIIAMLDEEDERDRIFNNEIDVSSWDIDPDSDVPQAVLRSTSPGYLQHFDLKHLNSIAREHKVQIALERAPGDFVAAQELLISIRPADKASQSVLNSLASCYTLGATRTAVQDVTFLSDQLVEVLVRALSPGINDPHTAMLCLDWLRAGLAAFARRAPSQPVGPRDAVLYKRITCESMMERSFDRMRQHIASDRTVTLYAVGALADIAIVASRLSMVQACERQMKRLVRSALELQRESLAREEIEEALKGALEMVGRRRSSEIGEGPLRDV